jgi:hypothetical protein
MFIKTEDTQPVCGIASGSRRFRQANGAGLLFNQSP